MIFILLVLWMLLLGKLLQWMLQKVMTSHKATNIFIYYRGIGSFCKTIYRTIASTIKACYCIMISIAILLLQLAFCLFFTWSLKSIPVSTNSCKTIIAMAFNFLLHQTLRHFLTWTFYSRLSLMSKKGDLRLQHSWEAIEFKWFFNGFRTSKYNYKNFSNTFWLY